MEKDAKASFYFMSKRERELAFIEEMTIRKRPEYFFSVYSEYGNSPLAVAAEMNFRNPSPEPFIRILPRRCGSTTAAVDYGIYRMITLHRQETIFFFCSSGFDVAQTMKQFAQRLQYAIDIFIPRALEPYGEHISIHTKHKKIWLESKRGTKLTEISFENMFNPNVLKGHTSQEFIVDLQHLGTNSKRFEIVEENLHDMFLFSGLSGHRLTIFQSGLSISKKSLIEDHKSTQYLSFEQFSHINPIEYQSRMLNNFVGFDLSQYALECLCSREVFDNEQQF